MCAECPARFMFCLNTGLRAVNNAEAAPGAELLQGSDEARAATRPWHLSASHRITEPWIQLSLLKKLLIIIIFKELHKYSKIIFLTCLIATAQQLPLKIKIKKPKTPTNKQNPI